MRKFVALLVALVISVTLLTHAYVISRPKNVDSKLYSSRSNPSLGTMGSDVLMRPEDENSQEFKDYLRNLLKLQANRAKTGFSAPSSGTSDAYLAKLNRLKLEREALRKAGLPDSEIDIAYKPEDYEAAVFESQEPLVANAVLTGDAAIAAAPGVSRTKSGNKMRELTSEEIAAAKSAEEAVGRALAKGGVPLTRQNSDLDGTDMSPGERLRKQLSMQSLPGDDEDLLENLLQKTSNANNQNNVRTSKPGKQPNYIESLQKNLSDKGNNVQQRPSESNTRPAQQSSFTANSAQSALLKELSDKGNNAQQRPSPVESNTRPAQQSSFTANSAQRTRPVQSPPVESVRPVQVATTSVNVAESVKSLQQVPIEGSKSVKLSTSEKFRALQPKSASDDAVENAPKSSPVAQKVVKLSMEDLELSAQTLQLLIKHRGGGPFGLGRLQGEEIKDLHNKLGEIVVALETDSIQNSVEIKQVNSPKAVVVPTPQVTDKVTETEAVVVTKSVAKPTNFASPLPKAAPTKSSTPLPKAAPTKSSTPSQDVPKVDNDLAFSNQFEAKTVNVPIALGLDKFLQTPRALDIDELSALRDGLIQCLAIVQGEVSARAAAPINNVTKDPVERQFASTTANDIPIEKDVKAAIGLLLKHRGGPGFGHGRLQGKELEYLETKLNQVVDRLEAEI